MSGPLPTLQRVDPLLVQGSTLLTLSGVIVGLGYAVLAALTTGSLTDRPLLTSAVLLVMLMGSVILLTRTSSARPPLTVVAAAAAAAPITIISAFEVYAHDPVIDLTRTSWAPLAAGVILLPLALYRPQRELAWATVFNTAFVVVGAWFGGDELTEPAVRVVYVLMSAFPIAVLGAASAAFAQVTVSTIVLWGDQVEEESRLESARLRTGIARSVQQEQVSILGAEVVPLLARIAETGQVHEADRVEAAALSARIRTVLVAERDSSWLDRLLAELPHGGGRPVADVGRAAEGIPAEQRARLRAFLTAVIAHPDYESGSIGVRVELRSESARIDIAIQARLDTPENRVRAALAPYLAVLGPRFREVGFRVQSAFLELRLSCDPDD